MTANAAGADLPVAMGTRIAAVRSRIAAACDRAGRDPASVTLIAVSKTHPAEVVLAASQLGLTDFGENRVQEAAAKIDDPRIREASPVWHLIGHLQTNKAKDAVRHFALIHSVDSERLLRAVAKEAESRAEAVRILLEVNVAGEASKFGLTPTEVPTLVEVAMGLPHVRVEGLMTVAPHVADPEAVRPVFRELRRLAGGTGLDALSMGMTDDFEIAIEEGATHIRVGRAIFGERAT
jgi:pyridoxal phosphate enzyme (YggS family)